MRKSMLVIGLCTLVSLNASAVLISSDDFNGTDYGPNNSDINGQSGGGGDWATNTWADGSSHIRWINDVWPHMTYAATGYENTGTDDGKMGRSQSGTKYPSRVFSSSAINSGTVWVSYISKRLSVNSVSDFSSLRFRDGNNNWVYIGSSANDFGIGNSALVNKGQAADVYTANMVHLVIAKIDLSDGSISAWLDPSDVTSEAALGTADASVSAATLGFTISSLDGMMGIVMGDDASNWEAMDSIRIGTELVDVVAKPGRLGLVLLF